GPRARAAVTGFLQQTVNGISIGSVYVLVGVGLTLVFGVSRAMNYAQGQFLILGSFAGSAAVSPGRPWVGALILSTVGVGFLGAGLYRTMFQRLASNHLATFIMTVGLGIVIQQAIVEIWGPGQRQINGPFTGTINIGGVIITDSRILILAAC